MNESWVFPSPNPNVMSAQLNESVRQNSQRQKAKNKSSCSFLPQPDSYLGKGGVGFGFGWDLGWCRRQFLSVLDEVSPGFNWVETDPTNGKMLQANGASSSGLRRIASFDIDEFAVAAWVADMDGSWCVSVCVIDRFRLTSRPEMLAVFSSVSVAELGMCMPDGSFLSLLDGDNDADRLAANLILRVGESSVGSRGRAL